MIFHDNLSDPRMGFDEESVLMYDHMIFGGPPVMAESEEEANELVLVDEKESANGNQLLLVSNFFLFDFCQ